jgi:hypothetical protein
VFIVHYFCYSCCINKIHSFIRSFVGSFVNLAYLVLKE